MTTLKQILKTLILLVLLALIARTVHAQGAPCNPYADQTCGGGGSGPFVNPYTLPGGPIGGLGPYAGPNDPTPYNLGIPDGVSMAWTINGDLHLDQQANSLGWLVLKSLDPYDQVATVMFTFEDHAPVFEPVALPALGRVTVSMHDTTKFPILQHRFYGATAFFQRAGHMYATFARACTVVNGGTECQDSHDVGSVEVRMK